MPRIHVTTRDGSERVLEAGINQTLMEVIRDSGIQDLEAICGGCCSCATCHVYIDPSFSGRLPPASEDEHILLEDSRQYNPELSRLSCQIRVSEAMDGLALVIAPEG